MLLSTDKRAARKAKQSAPDRLREPQAMPSGPQLRPTGTAQALASRVGSLAALLRCMV